MLQGVLAKCHATSRQNAFLLCRDAVLYGVLRLRRISASRRICCAQDDRRCGNQISELHQSPTPTGSARIRAGAGTRTGTELGIKATTVPAMMIQTPIQIHMTRGFKWTLMIGFPVSGFCPSYTTYRSSCGVERFATMVEVCWLAL